MHRRHDHVAKESAVAGMAEARDESEGAAAVERPSGGRAQASRASLRDGGPKLSRHMHAHHPYAHALIDCPWPFQVPSRAPVQLSAVGATHLCLVLRRRSAAGTGEEAAAEEHAEQNEAERSEHRTRRDVA